MAVDLGTVFSEVVAFSKKMLMIAVSMVYPPKCIVCGSFLNISGHTDYKICNKCDASISRLLIRDMHCTDKSIMFADDIICLFDYAGEIRRSLIRYKFRNKASYGRTFGYLLALMLKRIPLQVSGFDMLLAVPLHSSREAERGYDQAMLVAKHLSRLSGIPFAKRVLVRMKNTSRQSMLGRSGRSANVSGAFSICKPNSVKGKHILLLDDIITTGSTVSECARILKESGAEFVAAIAVASGRKGFR